MILDEIPLTTSVTNIHSPTAFSHQTITQIHTNERKIVLKPKSLTPVVKTKPLFETLLKETENFEDYYKNRDETLVLTAKEVEDIKTDDHESSSSPYISYKDNTPVFISQSHTPAHLTYAATPIVYKMLPEFKKYHFRNYEKYFN